MNAILYVHHGKGIGGAPLSLLYTIQGLKREFKPTILFLHNGAIIKKFEKEGAKCIVNPFILDLSHTEVSSYKIWNPMFWFRLFWQPVSFYKFYKICKQNDAQIVHLNTSSLITLAIAAKCAGKKVVMHIREPLASGRFGIRQWILRELIYRFTDAVIPISEYDASRLKPSSKITVVHNFVDFEVFDKQKKCTKYSGLKKGKKMILHLGGISTLKGTHVLIESLKFLKTRDFSCVIAGADKDKLGGLKKYLTRELKENQLQDKVEFIPPVFDPHELIACADVVVFPSTRPHFARPIIEASAMAKPVIASNLGGPRELVINGKTGFLVKPNDPKALASALDKLLGNSKLANKMGTSGYELAREKFDQGKNVEKIKQVYHKLLSLNKVI